MRAIELDPNYAEAYYNCGITYGKKGELDHAIVDFTKAIELNPNYADAYYNRGVAYSNKGLVDRTIKDYTKVIALNPNYANAYYNLGRVWLHLREWEKAKSNLMGAREKGIDIITAFHNDYEGFAGFERITGIQLPADLVEMLTPQQ